MVSQNFEVRDQRSGDWFWTHKQIIFRKDLLSSDKLVYCGLACYANNQSQSLFPSIARLKDDLGIGKNTLIRSLKKLEQTGYIEVKRETGRHNIYFLLKVKTAKTKNYDLTVQRKKLAGRMGI